MFDSFKVFKWIIIFMYGYGGAKKKKIKKKVVIFKYVW